MRRVTFALGLGLLALLANGPSAVEAQSCQHCSMGSGMYGWISAGEVTDGVGHHINFIVERAGSTIGDATATYYWNGITSRPGCQVGYQSWQL